MNETRFEKNILCIGAGYVGGPTMAMVAAKCPQYLVTVVDLNMDRIKAWQTDDLPIYEPMLLDLVKKARGKNLFFTTELEENIKKADIIYVSVNTPTKAYGEGAGKSADLQYWEKTARDILRISESDKIIVEKSTLPVRTASAMERILNFNSNGIQFEVISNPEFLAEGTAINDLENPDRVLIGSRETENGRKARNAVVEINEYQENRFVKNINKAFFNTIANKRIAIFGFAFKANTGDTRESPAIYVAKKLLEEHAHVVVTDPEALENAKRDLAHFDKNIQFEVDPYEASRNTHAIAVVTEWDEYKSLDYEKIFQAMEKPAYVFDGRNLLDHHKLHEIGFNVYPIGKPALTHFQTEMI